MYLQHFGLHELPFSLTPDTDFTFAHAGHQSALNTVMLALQNGEGFLRMLGGIVDTEGIHIDRGVDRALIRRLNSEV